MVLKRVAVGAQKSIVNTQYLALYPPEARPVPVLGEVHELLPLDLVIELWYVNQMYFFCNGHKGLEAMDIKVWKWRN